MKKIIAFLSLALLPVVAMAAGGGGVPLQSADIDLTDHEAMQRGAKYYVNYCQGCHSLQYFRYERMQDFGLTNDQIKDNLIFDKSKKVGDLMTINMPEAAAAEWFGTAPPDLTLTARLKHGGGDWIYTYLKGFYKDDSRPFGVNNLVFPNVGMPHVLIGLQGVQEAVIETDEHGNKHVKELKLVTPGSLSPEEYDQVAKDLATFLVHVAEPMKLERQRIGIWVMLFLFVFFIVSFLLKKEYWKDVH
ncbi:MAG TPA: cytochrome c1 [Chromatiaceae bacterium]|nr:cytochrome c1 [Chromatiaceae bacterium]